MKNKLDLKKQFKEAKKYVKESSNYIYATIILFFASAIFGFLYRENLTFLNKFLEELISQTIGLNTAEMIFFILQNNLQSALFAIFLGAIFGVFPVFSSLSNGVVLGYVLGISYETVGIGIWWRLLPHGIFELPAIFISFGLGMKLGFSLFSKKKSSEFKKRFYNSMNVMLTIIIPLLIIAAIIEGVLIFLVD